MPMNTKTRALMAKLNPDEKVIDGGPARCKSLDLRTFEVLEDLLGGVADVRRFAKSQGAGAGSFMEADWVATDVGLYYANYKAGMHHGWAWGAIHGIDDTGSASFGTMRRLSIKLATADIEISVSRGAARELLAFARSRGIG